MLPAVRSRSSHVRDFGISVLVHILFLCISVSSKQVLLRSPLNIFFPGSKFGFKRNCQWCSFLEPGVFSNPPVQGLSEKEFGVR